MPDPALENLSNIVAHWNEIGRKRLRELRPHLSRVLLNEPGVEVDVPETKRRKGVVSRAGHDRERYQGAITLFDIGPARHAERDVPDLLNRWNRSSPCGLRYGGIL